MLITHYPDSPLHRNGCFKTAAPRRMAHQDARMSEIQEEKNMDALKLIAQSSMKADMPKVQVGDYVRVNVKIREGDKERIQAFEGTVIAMKHGGISETFTVRRVAHGVGIERVFPIHSPRVDSVDVLRHGVVRRAKLYYLRNRVGKAARVKEKIV